MSDVFDHEADAALPLYPLMRGDQLQNHEWFPLHFHKLLGSDFVSDVVADGRRADLATALILWSEAMRQDPAGTLPTEDKRLYQLARFPTIEAWRDVREGALHGFFRVLVSDQDGGHVVRLAHPLLTEEAVKMCRRKRGRADGRAENNKAQARSRILKRLKELKIQKAYHSSQFVDELRAWLEESGLTITEDNVRTAFERATGGGIITPFSNR